MGDLFPGCVAHRHVQETRAIFWSCGEDDGRWGWRWKKKSKNIFFLKRWLSSGIAPGRYSVTDVLNKFLHTVACLQKAQAHIFRKYVRTFVVEQNSRIKNWRVWKESWIRVYGAFFGCWKLSPKHLGTFVAYFSFLSQALLHSTF